MKTKTSTFRFMTLAVYAFLAVALLVNSSAALAAAPQRSASQSQAASCGEGEFIVDWTALPWPVIDRPSLGNLNALTSPQNFTNIDGTGIDLEVSWVNAYEAPYVYATDAPIQPEMSTDLRLTNGRNTDPAGNAVYTFTFSEPILLSNVTIGSLSKIGSNFEWSILEAYATDAQDAPLVAATSISNSTYLRNLNNNTLLNLVSVPGQPFISIVNDFQVMHGVSVQPSGYDRATFGFDDNDAGVQKLVLTVWNSPSTDFGVAIETPTDAPNSVTIETMCFRGTPSAVTLSQNGTAPGGSPLTWVALSLVSLLVLATGQLLLRRRTADQLL